MPKEKDPYCPLGFHPQVRWPTRCKRCFREFKDHLSKKDELNKSTSFDGDSSVGTEEPVKLRSSSVSLTVTETKDDSTKSLSSKNVDSESLSVPSLALRRKTTDLSEVIESVPSETFTFRLKKRNSIEESSSSLEPHAVSEASSPKTDSAEKGESSKTDEGKVKVKKKVKKKKLLIQEVKEVAPQESEENNDNIETPDSSADVAFIIQVKSKTKKREDDDETLSLTTTTDTDATLVDTSNYMSDGLGSWEVEEFRKEVERLKEKCDKLEKEKSEILLRRVSNLEAPRAQSSDYLKLQQKVNQLQTINEDLKDEQKHLEARVRELESDLNARPNTEATEKVVSELRSKLSTTEAQLDQMLEEKREAQKQMKDMQDEFEEMQDGFREEQAEEFANLKRELDDASKNCRLLQFKLRKVEKKSEQVEVEKKIIERRLESAQEDLGKMAKLEEELVKAKSENDKLIKDGKATGKSLKAQESQNTLSVKKKSPVLTKAASGEKVDPPLPADLDVEQTLRDLQSTLEREADLREQLKFSEEESTSMRQKISRIEEENDSLLMQIKKMSSKTMKFDNKSNKPESGKLGAQSNHNDNEKLDASELKLQLEVNEQESKVQRKKIDDLEKTNAKLTKEIQTMEDKLHSLESSTSFSKSKNLDEVSMLRRKLIEKEREVERLETELQAAASKNKGKFIRGKVVDVLDNKSDDGELKKAQAEISRLKDDAEKQKQALKDALERAEAELEMKSNFVKELEERNSNLLESLDAKDDAMASMKEQYENTQDDFVIKISQLQDSKENDAKELENLRKEFEDTNKELKNLRQTYNSRQDSWIKEKLMLEDKIKELESKMKKLVSIPGDNEAQRLRTLLQEQTRGVETTKQELNVYKDQILQLQRDNDGLRKQIQDYDKVVALQQRNRMAETPQISETELKALKEKLISIEKRFKNEIAQTKLQHDHNIAEKTEEIATLQANLSRAKRERDTFRQMVDSAQRAIAELKSRGNLSRSGSTSTIARFEEAATSAQATAETLQDRVAQLEDELSNAKREVSRVRTEMATEKSTWEVQLAEKQQKINELEEDRLLGVGGTSRPRGSSNLGKTRIELAWQKEREEQQRRLKEATTLARDLKSTLFEIERERDRERLEAKRRLEQLKAAMEEEQDDMRRKVVDTQGSLLELRDAHAKLRSANDKLRKDREKLESERELIMKSETEAKRVRNEKERMLDELMARLGEVHDKSHGSFASSALQPSEILQYLSSIKSIVEPESISRSRKQSHFKRAASLGDPDIIVNSSKSRESLQSIPSSYLGRHQSPFSNPSSSSTQNKSVPRKNKIRSNVSDGESPKSHSKGSLSRKAVSLEQTASAADDQNIWKGGSDVGSMSSMNSDDGNISRGSSLERMSATSSKSDKPKSKGLFGKMKKLVKSKSIEESSTAEQLVMAGVQVSGVASSAGSDLSLNSEGSEKERGSRMKNKVKGIFKRSSRSPSLERKNQSSTSSSAQILTKDRLVKSEQPPNPSDQPGLSKSRPLASMQRPLMPSQLGYRS